jgi:hypothetical protein
MPPMAGDAVPIAGPRALGDLFEICLGLLIFPEQPINRADARYGNLRLGDASEA